MPRSGTSLTARVLNIMGVELGPEEHMLEPTARSNPKGYWEQREINALNDAILSVFGGSFEHPPDLPPGWQNDPALDALKERARGLLSRYFGSARLWGFKDPRNSITQPFWRELVPGMAAVLCIRAPEDVATSWQRHDRGVNDLDWNEPLSVWLQYNAAALQGTSGAERLVVSQERFLAHPQDEVDRLASFLTDLGAPPDAAAVREATGFVDAGLVHHHTDPRESLEDDRVPAETRSLYARMLDLAETQDVPSDVDAFAAELWRSHRDPAPEPRRRFRPKLPSRSKSSDPPVASLDWPPDGAVLNRNDVWAWGRAVFPDALTARVLVSLDGGQPMRARLAVARDDTPGRREGFELLVPPRALPAGVDEVDIAVTAVSSDGTSLDLGRRRVRLEAPQQGTDQNDERAARLRQRVSAAPEAGTGDTLLAVASRLDHQGARDSLLDLLPRLDHEVTLAASMDRPLHDRFEAAGATVHMGASVPLASPATYEARLTELAGWLSVEAPRGVLADGIDSFPLVDLAQRLGIPSVWLLRETVDLQELWIRRGLAGPEYEYARDRAHLALRQSAAVVFPSRASRDVYRAYCNPERTSIVPTPVDVERVQKYRAAVDRSAIRAALGVPEDATLIFSPRGDAELVQAVAELRKKHSNARLELLPDGGGSHWFEAADIVLVDEDPEDVPLASLQAMAF